MEIVCTPETYRRFKSSSLRQQTKHPLRVLFCLALERACRSSEVFGGAREQRPQTEAIFFPLSCRRCEALQNKVLPPRLLPTLKNRLAGRFGLCNISLTQRFLLFRRFLFFEIFLIFVVFLARHRKRKYLPVHYNPRSRI